MRSPSRPAWIGLCALALAACDRASQPVACTPSIEHGLFVTVVDSITGSAPSSATLIARDGAYVDSVGPYSPYPGSGLLFSAVSERPGSYDLTVHAPGYLSWTRTGVNVAAGKCHVETVHLTARLRK